MDLYCTGCEVDVSPRLTNGEEIYPHRPDLFELPFWKCDSCNNYVGCHHKTDKPTTPLGCIPTKEIKEYRKKIHALIDPIWKSGKITRRQLYLKITVAIGWSFHTAKIRSVEEAKQVIKAIMEV